MSASRVPVAEVGADDYRIVRRTHDLKLATRLMRAKLLEEGCPEGECNYGPWGDGSVCLHKPHVGGARREWLRIVPALPGTNAHAEGWKFAYWPAEPNARGAFRAVTFW